jgi:uncharacterized membrane protein YjdF
MEHRARPVSSRVPLVCLAVFGAVWLALAIAPRYRADWVLENLPTIIALPAVVWGARRFHFSDRAYVQATIFALLHTIGSPTPTRRCRWATGRAMPWASSTTTTTGSCTSRSGS